jgi:hypothetical protein
MGSRSVVAAVLGLLLTGCGPPADEGPELDAGALTEAWGCGHGFAVGTRDQDVALLIHLSPDGETAYRDTGDLERTVDLPDPAWNAEVRIGRRLFSEWCDDVAGPPELAPVVEETWEVTGGLILIGDRTPPRSPHACDGATATARLAGLEVTPPDGEPLLVGDLRLVNDGWGCFAG